MTVQTEFARRSPIRTMERHIHDGLGKGQIGVLASPKGVGKTACLVQIATDKLFQDKPVIHVSYASRVDYIITWYEDVFREIAGALRTEAPLEVHDDVVKNRVIMNFKQEGTRTEQVLKSLEAMITMGRFAADSVIVDGYDFSLSSPADLAKFREFAGRLGLEIWFSASLRGEGSLYDASGAPLLLQDFLASIDVLITLHAEPDHVRLRVVKDRNHPAAGDLPLKLDPKTLLIA
ncbi:MAG: hypothetical protein JW742_03250 [Candidatus Aminicenantes bacterium]|nr:hypothetical protein [Candidatus Aminicenantes bacterium]